eukprot:NODE_219_length_12440_cov_2.445588.p3 type:complete len:487 gc:universal NODE_219_length_12440_cov_2.445588:11706-10246(-)
MSDLGKALINRQRKQKLDPLPGKNELMSNTKENELDDFLAQASLDGTNFESEKLHVKFISQTVVKKKKYNILTPEEEQKMIESFEKLQVNIKLPRRPKWDSNTSKEELHSVENEEFLKWRGQLAEIEETHNLLMTPFEKNLMVWKELWRVVERGDLIVQIVDARNPLLFRCSDLEKYVHEVDSRKKNLLLVNKADLLSEDQRIIWKQYFRKNNIEFVFFSAKQEEGDHLNDVLDVDSLITELYKRCPPPLHPSPKTPNMKTISFCGHPNVGKSSTINAMVGSKKVTVSSTPGKTKHFQTLMLNSQLCLCDCPGLVFPSFATTRADMVCNGILPIDNLKDYLSPCALIVNRIPAGHFSKMYGIRLPKEVDAEECLSVLARARGFMTSGFGVPDISRSARILLKDYVEGKLVYAEPPPKYQGQFNFYDESGNLYTKKTNVEILDDEFFDPKAAVKAQTKGVFASQDFKGQVNSTITNSKKHYKKKKGK